MDYIVSVVVPTKNRYKYLKYLIKLVDGFHLKGLELVIQDNSDDNTEIQEYLKIFDNTDIKYYYSADSLTMSGNADVGILHSTGEYICYIGDDDGVCRNIVDCAKWLKKNGYDAATSRVAFYTWGKKVKVIKSLRSFVVRDTSIELRRLVRKGMILLDAHTPLIYQAIVRKSEIMKIFQKYGTFFPSCPPDIAGSVALSFIVNKFCEINIPVVINGASEMTGGGVRKEGGIIPLERVGFITQKDVDKWEPTLPKVWTGAYAWANSGIKTFRIMGHPELADACNLEYTLAYATAIRPGRKIMWHYSMTYTHYRFNQMLLILGIQLKHLLEKVMHNIPFFYKQYKNVATILEAEHYISVNTNGSSVKLFNCEKI